MEDCRECGRPIPSFPSGNAPAEMRWDALRYAAYQVHGGKCAKADTVRCDAAGIDYGFSAVRVPWEQLSVEDQASYRAGLGPAARS